MTELGAAAVTSTSAELTIQNLLTALVPHVETRTHTQDLHPHSFFIFFFPSYMGKCAFSLSSTERGLKLMSWQSGTV